VFVLLWVDMLVLFPSPSDLVTVGRREAGVRCRQSVVLLVD
jgi:hypothetical protein